MIRRDAIGFNIAAKYLGHFQKVELLALEQNEYLGGAHGMGIEVFYNFYHDKLLTLEDILLPEQKATFEKLAQTAFMNSEYKEGLLDNFVLTENFTFTEKGIKLLWQPYEITSYATGMPTITLPYTSLEGVVKPEFLGK
ncbi:RsiV family protein [Suttonella ornithocola]|uniref:Protein of uncharacterized function (DUF3298) n=1 Tax=Suttonella ornithocola TaxID=279832 RepID=A0A380MZI3_9GAMM|nr:RsiV family protein [Suttonella ornithocola]SUO97436.1 Protein of uncharacterised function (DUF3298) [Suttonella ornithocola]